MGWARLEADSDKTGTTENLVAVRGVGGGPEVWALGSSQTLLRWDGKRWQHLWTAERATPAGQRKSKADDVVRPSVARHPAAKARFKDEFPAQFGPGEQSGTRLNDIWAADLNRVWVVGAATFGGK